VADLPFSWQLMNSDYDMPVNLGNPDEYTVGDSHSGGLGQGRGAQEGMVGVS
jgi:hypothetical protein